ncbi:DUF4342 domain-containing protein [Atribacter laminatus]|jgi:hypothetical protein|uniref:DUF4342 domain-containing protein n=1 Tax=Atribacter laminatus TaxID=2847778 RepID=A0A7T1F3I3_ATRLM|nr:DUF4342 domain-containing protein [Atribacter laminatus]QPM68685.1 hypothetical protein RT761_01907 [Atribacter laminatus]
MTSRKTWTEEIEVNARDIIEKIKELIQEGNVRRLIIKKENGDLLLEVPLTAGVVAGGLVTLVAPVLAALGAMAALLTKVKFEIVRVKEENTDDKKDDEDKEQ